MATRKDGAVLRQLNTLFNLGAIRELTDGQLLERFATGRGKAAELAFAGLCVEASRRNGTARSPAPQLADPHDRQDAFQATFLVLVKKARACGFGTRSVPGSIKWPFARRPAASIGGCPAAQARATSGRACGGPRRKRKGDPTLREEQLLHEEIDRVPDRYRDSDRSL